MGLKFGASVSSSVAHAKLSTTNIASIKFPTIGAMELTWPRKQVASDRKKLATIARRGSLSLPDVCANHRRAGKSRAMA